MSVCKDEMRQQLDPCVSFMDMRDPRTEEFSSKLGMRRKVEVAGAPVVERERDQVKSVSSQSPLSLRWPDDNGRIDQGSPMISSGGRDSYPVTKTRLVVGQSGHH